MTLADQAALTGQDGRVTDEQPTRPKRRTFTGVNHTRGRFGRTSFFDASQAGQFVVELREDSFVAPGHLPTIAGLEPEVYVAADPILLVRLLPNLLATPGATPPRASPSPSGPRTAPPCWPSSATAWGSPPSTARSSSKASPGAGSPGSAH